MQVSRRILPVLVPARGRRTRRPAHEELHGPMTVFQQTRRAALEAAHRMERIRSRRAAFEKRRRRARCFPADQLMRMYKRTQARWVLQAMMDRRTGLFGAPTVRVDASPRRAQPMPPTLWSQVG